jgi:hypothetical protein
MNMISPGESIDLDTRVDGGPTIHRDENCTDGYAIDNHGGELYEDEIKRLAEAAGFEVTEEN